MMRVTDTLWRGPRPNNLEDLEQLGFQCIISLESGIYELFHSDKLEFEEQHPEDFKMASYFCPMSDFTPPKYSKVVGVFDILQYQMPKKTYLHCKAGVDRTGFVCAAYRMKVQGWSFDQAVNEYRQMGRHKRFFWWDWFLKQYEIKP